MKLLAIFLLAFAGCASNQVPFQKNDGGVGYSVETKGSANFFIKTNLPSDFEQNSIKRYVARAVGEECLQQGFKYFDYTAPMNGISEGFCFKENKRKALAVTFEEEGLTELPPKFVIKSLNQKTNSKLLIGDKITKVEGREVTSVSELKSLAFQFGQKDMANTSVEVIRNGKDLIFSEPLADLSFSAFGPDSL